MLRVSRFIPIPAGGAANRFDHGAFDPSSKRVFVAHTSANALVVLDDATGRHEATLPRFPEAAGVVVAGGTVLISNRGAASITTVDAATLAIGVTHATAERPNGVALAAGRQLAVVACLGDETHPPVLESIALGTGERTALSLPGRPRWCVVDREETWVYCAIQEPSLVLGARLPALDDVTYSALPAAGAHGIDLDAANGRLFVACDAGVLCAVSTTTGVLCGQWPLGGPLDATCYNPASGLVHVAVKDPGVVVTVDPGTNQVTTCPTEAGAGTTALVAPNRLYVFLPQRSGALELVEEGRSA